MALVIEDGSIVAGADSYITELEYTTWADARFGSGRTTAPVDDAATQALIYRSMDYFEAQSFQGCKVERTQSLQWPRSNVVIDKYYVDTDEIPDEVKLSIYELCYAEETGESSLQQIDRKVKRKKVSSIEVEYADNSSSTAIVPAISSSMKKLLSNGGGLGGFNVRRA